MPAGGDIAISVLDNGSITITLTPAEVRAKNGPYDDATEQANDRPQQDDIAGRVPGCGMSRVIEFSQHSRRDAKKSP